MPEQVVKMRSFDKGMGFYRFDHSREPARHGGLQESDSFTVLTKSETIALNDVLSANIAALSEKLTQVSNEVALVSRSCGDLATALDALTVRVDALKRE